MCKCESGGCEGCGEELGVNDNEIVFIQQAFNFYDIGVLAEKKLQAIIASWFKKRNSQPNYWNYTDLFFMLDLIDMEFLTSDQVRPVIEKLIEFDETLLDGNVEMAVHLNILAELFERELVDFDRLSKIANAYFCDNGNKRLN